MKIREFLNTNVGPSIAPTLVRLNEWLTSIQAGKSDKHASRAMANAHLIEQIAKSLIGNASGTEQKLLSKSLQEALYYSLGFETNVDYAELKTQLSRYVNRRGVSSFIHTFLSLFFFNFVRFETGESFRAMARTSKAFERYLDGIDSVCHQTVDSVWKSFEKTKRPLDLRAAADIVAQIEEQLHGE